MKTITINNPKKYWNISVKGIPMKIVPENISIMPKFDGWYWHIYNTSNLCFKTESIVPNPIKLLIPDNAFVLVSTRVDNEI